MKQIILNSRAGRIFVLPAFFFLIVISMATIVSASFGYDNAGSSFFGYDKSLAASLGTGTTIINYNNVTQQNNITVYQNTTEVDPVYTADKIIYLPYWYNMTTPFATWLAGFVYNYNQTQAVTLNDVGNPSADKLFTMANKQLVFRWTNPNPTDGAMELEAIGAFTGDILHIHQHTGNPSAGTDAVHIEAADSDVNGINITTTGIPLWINGNNVLTWMYNQSDGCYNITYPQTKIYTINSNVVSSSNQTINKWNTSIMEFPLLKNSNYTFDCLFFVSTTIATSGVQLNTTFTKMPQTMNLEWIAWTTATANREDICLAPSYSCSSDSTASLVAGTTSALKGRVETNSSSNHYVNFTMTQEVGGFGTVYKGSYCKIQWES